jgi:hypothetical protein
MLKAIRERQRDKGVAADTNTAEHAVKEPHDDLFRQIDAHFAANVSKPQVVASAENDASRGQPTKASKGRRQSKPRVTTSTLFAMADDLWTLVGGDTRQAEKLLAHLATIDIETLQRAFRGFCDLVAVSGGVDAARKTIASMKKSGLIE